MMHPTQLIFQGHWTHKSQGTVLQLTTDHQMICAQAHTQCHKSYVRVILQVRVICTSKGMQKSLGCALYVRCALSVGKYGKKLQAKGLNLFVHSAVILVTGPYPIPKRVLHRARSSASSFNFQYPLLSLRLSSSCVRLLPRLTVTSLLPSSFSSITCFQKAVPMQYVINPVSLYFYFMQDVPVFPDFM